MENPLQTFSPDLINFIKSIGFGKVFIGGVMLSLRVWKKHPSLSPQGHRLAPE